MDVKAMVGHKEFFVANQMKRCDLNMVFLGATLGQFIAFIIAKYLCVCADFLKCELVCGVSDNNVTNELCVMVAVLRGHVTDMVIEEVYAI